MCHEWNQSYRISALRLVGKVMHSVTRSKRFLSASILKLRTAMVVMRLLWSLEHYADIRTDEDAIYGTIDTFLVWKLTGGKVHATEPSNACVSGFYDPFILKWAGWAVSLFDIPPHLLPEVRETNAYFGETESSLFGGPIRIHAVAGDQQAAMFGECCFEPGDIKVTMGTGSFLNINTGTKAFSSFTGVYPVVGWKLVGSKSAVYLAETSSADTGTIIDWAKSIDLFREARESSSVASSVADSDNVFFVPAFSGLFAPYNDASAMSGLLGLTQNTRKEHMARAVLESIAYRIKQVFEIISTELSYASNKIKVDGGVASNDFVVQLVADLTNCDTTRDRHREMSSLGAAALAGLAIGYWPDQESLKKLRHPERTFTPNANHEVQSTILKNYNKWKLAVDRCLSWYK